MNFQKKSTVEVLTLAVALFFSAPIAGAENASGRLDETLRLQSTVAASSCSGVQRTISAGNDPALVVRTAVELGYNSCQVIRCALGGTYSPQIEKKTLCEKVIRGAVDAGVQPDVITRCSADACDPAAVAAILSATMLEPNYCYFAPWPLVAPAPPPPPEPVFQRSYTPAEASPFTF